MNIHTFNKTSQKLTNCFGTLSFLIVFPPGLVSHRFVLKPCHFVFVSTRFGLSQVCFGTLPFWFCFHQVGFPHRFVLEPCHFDFVSTRLGSLTGLFWNLAILIVFPPGLVSHRFVLESCHLDFVSIRLVSLTVFWFTLSGVFSSSVPLQVCLGDCQLGVHFHRVWSLTGLFWNLAFLLCFHQVGFSYRFVWNLAILILFSPGLSQGWFGTFSRFDFVSKKVGFLHNLFLENIISVFIQS